MTTLTKKQARTVTKVAERLDPPPLGVQIDKIWSLREDKRALEAKIKEIEADVAIREAALMETLDIQQTDKAAGTKASASISSAVVANIKDWDAFTAFVAKKKFFHLIQRRVNDAAARELFETQGNVPGLEPFTKRKLNIRTI